MIADHEVQSTVLRPMRETTVKIHFVRSDSPESMRSFLGAAAATVTTTDIASRVRKAGGGDAVNVGVTGAGLRLAEIDPRAHAALSATFTAGMRAAADRLGDDPKGWPAPFHLDVPFHAVVLQYGGAKLGRLAKFTKGAPVWRGRRAGSNVEPFGFRDGLSNPVIEGSGKALTAGNGVWDTKAQRWRAVRAGEAVLGYVDESGAVAGHPDAAHIERNGSYLVIRKLRQDVDDFKHACREWGNHLGLSGDTVAAKLVGRTKDGTVLGATPGDADNDFLYRGTDVGEQVRVSAHIRRANPRDGIAYADEIVRHHLIFRRGYPYTEKHESTQATREKGLLFMACCSDLRRQFEFVQSQWLQDGSRFGLGGERDGLIGTRNASDAVSIDVDHRRVRRHMSQFVTTLGGEYFLLPSRSALALLAREPER